MSKNTFSFRREIYKVVLPALAALGLFVLALFVFALPLIRGHLMEQKKQTLEAVTATAIEVLHYFDKQVSSGGMDMAVAKSLAREQLRELRYGRDGKDYFWINDLQPAMIMHPFRPDLEGRDLSEFRDPTGNHLFREMVEVARHKGSGYVAYEWQWKDDPERIDPKVSFLRLYAPWGWVVGTGLYIDDVEREIDNITRELVVISMGVFAVILLLSTHIIRNSLLETRRRLAAEKELVRYKDQLEELVEKRTAELKEAMARVKVLSGFLPICASCKKIRDDKGYWNQIESYIRDHSEAEFSHSICPDCVRKLYPDLDLSRRGKG